MLEAIYNYAITNQKGRDIPLLCKKVYSLQPCTFEAGVHYLELVQSALHRHKYTHFSDHNCDVVQLFCLHPGNASGVGCIREGIKKRSNYLGDYLEQLSALYICL